jgi:hypothetical protein
MPDFVKLKWIFFVFFDPSENHLYRCLIKWLAPKCQEVRPDPIIKSKEVCMKLSIDELKQISAAAPFIDDILVLVNLLDHGRLKAAEDAPPQTLGEVLQIIRSL